MSSINILLVDDRPANLVALRAVLEPLGENLMEASSGAAALELAARHEFAVVLLDVEMPIMDGFETASRLRTLRPDRRTPVLFITAVAVTEQDLQRGYALGGIDYILKPFDGNLLRNKVAAHAEAFRLTHALEARLQEASPTPEHPTVLVVNNDPGSLMAMVAALRGMEAEVLAAASAREALAVLLQRDVALILLDFHMPDMSGVEMARAVRENQRFAHTPIVFVSATTQASEDVKRGYAAGAADFIFVPIPAAMLRARVTALLSHYNYQRQLLRQLRDIEKLNAELSFSKNELHSLNVSLERRVQEQVAALMTNAEELRQRNVELAASGERFRLLVTSSSLVVWQTDATGLVKGPLPALQEFTGLSEAEIQGNGWSRAVHPDDLHATLEQWRRARTEKQNFRLQYRVRRHDGVYRHCVANGVPLLHPDGSVKEWFGAVMDVTENKELEARFLRAQRLESLGALAGGIAHDLNNVLSPVLMASEMLRNSIPDEESGRLLDLVRDSAVRGSEIIKQVLTFARGVKGERVPVQLRHLFRDMTHIARETFPKNITVLTDLADDLWTVTGDATQLHQVLMNLCINARDAMIEGGVLRLAARNVEIDEIMARMIPGARPGAHLVITVSDNGPGIPPEILDRIFDPFFTTKEHGKGTGLGLSTVMGIVSDHGGFVHATNNNGGGALFEITLPATPAKKAPEASAPVALEAGHGELILVVDDEPNIREITRKFLEKGSFRTLLAADGTEALILFSQHRESVRIVLCDMAMPILAGPATIKALRKLEPDLPVIGMTGNELQLRPDQLDELKLVTLLRKPFSAEKLFTALGAALQQKGIA